MRWPRGSDAAVAIALFLLSLAVRLPFLGAGHHGYEGAEFSVARQLGQEDTRVLYLENGEPGDAGPLFWVRPLHALVLYPASLFGFEAARLVMVAVASALAPATFRLARLAGASRPTALVAAFVPALVPGLAGAGTHLYPAALAAPLVLFALGERIRGRWPRALLWLVVASWIDETALLVLAGRLVLELRDGLHRREAKLWPVDLTIRQTAHLYALAPAAVFAGLHANIVSLFPLGHWGGATAATFLAEATLGGWLLVGLAFGLRSSSPRRWSAAALLLLAAHLLLAALGRAPDSSAALLPAATASVAAALTMESLLPEARRRRALVAAALLLVLLVAAVPGSVALKRTASPLAAQPSMAEAWTAARLENRDLEDARRQMDPTRWQAFFLIDVPWYHVYEPFHYALHSREGRFTSTPGVADVTRWGAWIERSDVVTVVAKNDHPLNRLVRETYGDCALHENPTYFILAGAACAGRGAELQRRWDETAAPP